MGGQNCIYLAKYLKTCVKLTQKGTANDLKVTGNKYCYILYCMCLKADLYYKQHYCIPFNLWLWVKTYFSILEM